MDAAKRPAAAEAAPASTAATASTPSPPALSVSPEMRAKINTVFRNAPTHHRNRSISVVCVEDRLQVCEFLKNHTCYDLLPQSYKVIVFDTTLPVKKAFYAMLQNEIRAAPLWSSRTESIVAMLTVTDFINILRHYHYYPADAGSVALQDHQIQTWRDMDISKSLPESSPSKPLKRLLSIAPMQSLLEAASMLIANRVHRVPLIDRMGLHLTEAATAAAATAEAGMEGLSLSDVPADGQVAQAQDCCIAVVTQFKILRFIAANFKAKPAFLRKTVEELGLGTFKNIATASMDTPLIQVLDIFTDRRISCVPIVDEHGVVIDVYEKYDVTYLARDGAYDDLNMTVREALQHRIEEIFEGVHTCTMEETLGSIFTTIQRQLVHRLIVVDADKRLKGIVSLSDILGFLLV